MGEKVHCAANDDADTAGQGRAELQREIGRSRLSVTPVVLAEGPFTRHGNKGCGDCHQSHHILTTPHTHTHTHSSELSALEVRQ
jgi:hypothetical protein